MCRAIAEPLYYCETLTISIFLIIEIVDLTGRFNCMYGANINRIEIQSADNANSTSSTVSFRQSPFRKPRSDSLSAPIASLTSRKEGQPIFAVIFRTWRFFPSVRVSSSQEVGIFFRTRMG